MVEEFKKEEVGLYRCRVDFRTAQTRNTFINVSLIGEEGTDDRIFRRIYVPFLFPFFTKK